MKTFYLEMLTPERKFFSGEVAGITLTAQDGEVEILANHAPVVVGLQPSIIWINDGEKRKYCASGEGFAVVEGNKVFVMCQTMEWPEEIDDERVSKAIEEHTKKLETAKSIVEYRLSKMTLSRAIARMKVKNTKPIE